MPLTRVPAPTVPGSVTVSTATDHCGCVHYSDNASTLINSTAIGTAKLVLYFPFALINGMVVAAFTWVNGSTVAGHIQMGVYDEGFNLLGNNGTTTSQTGTTAFQKVAPSATLSLKGNSRYYLAITSDDLTSTFSGSASTNAGSAGGFGIMSETTGSFGLINPGTPAVSTSELLFHCGITGSSVL